MVCCHCRREAPTAKYCGHCGAVQLTAAEGFKAFGALLQIVGILLAFWLRGPTLGRIVSAP
jgi:hypothetical protein